AWRAPNVSGKPQLLVRLGDKGGPCSGPLPITDHRLYVTQRDNIVSAASGSNFEVACASPIIVALNGDFDAGAAFNLSAYNYHATANDRGTVMASIAFGDQVASVVTVIEYYNAAFDHYFITWVPAEIALLDAGTTIKGWARTGKSFSVYATALSGTSAVC